jgi:hypothetical protein
MRCLSEMGRKYRQEAGVDQGLGAGGSATADLRQGPGVGCDTDEVDLVF